MNLDPSQRAVVEHRGSRALVLAGPGCGKTHILAERVAREHAVYGTAFSDMLCLTFTNRSARGMRDRIEARLGAVPEGLFVGNLHRFCVRFLHSNGLISPETTIIDEDDAAEFINRSAHMAGATWRSEVQAVAVDRYMQAHAYPERLRRRLWFEPQEQHYRCAEAYDRFKRDHGMMDFDDCLLWAYDALQSGDAALEYGRFGWVQVDEVQDLTPLQMAIVGLLAPAADATVMYLGDEQQAIFDFLGAGAEVLSRVKDECGGRVLRLGRNYRSTRLLTELCNAFATAEMGIDAAFLPDCVPGDTTEEEQPSIWSPHPSLHKAAVVGLVRRWMREHPDESVSVLVRTNAELAEVHRVLENAHVPHMAVGLRDTFRLVAFKTLYAHMAVAVNPMRTTEWARLLYQTGCVRRLEDAAALVSDMRDAAMTPADLLSADGMSAVERAVVGIDSGASLETEDLERLARLVFPHRRGAPLSVVFGPAGGPQQLQEYLAPMLRAKLSEQERLGELRDFDTLRARLYARYGELYAHTRRMMADGETSPANTLRAELDYVYLWLLLQGRITAIPRWSSVLELLASVVTDTVAEPLLADQLRGHLHELCTFNEGDIYDRGLAERLSVMTVHKAKGLEMDNVVLYNAATFWGARLDRARIFYVAFSRARKRLAVFCSGRLSPSVESVSALFRNASPDEIARVAE